MFSCLILCTLCHAFFLFCFVSQTVHLKSLFFFFFCVCVTALYCLCLAPGRQTDRQFTLRKGEQHSGGISDTETKKNKRVSHPLQTVSQANGSLGGCRTAAGFSTTTPCLRSWLDLRPCDVFCGYSLYSFENPARKLNCPSCDGEPLN